MTSRNLHTYEVGNRNEAARGACSHEPWQTLSHTQATRTGMASFRCVNASDL